MRDVGGGLFLQRFGWGVRFALSGIRDTFAHRRLLLWSLVPMVVQGLLFAALVFGGLTLSAGLVSTLRPAPGHWYSFVGVMLNVATIVLVVLLSVVAALLFGSALCDPFYDVLSAQTEALLLGRDVDVPLTPAFIARGVLQEVLGLPWKALLYVLVAGPLWVLSLTGVGAVIAVPLTLAWTWLFVALSGMSRSFGRHEVRRRRRLATLFSMPSMALGFGAVGWLISHVPLTSPFLIVGGTRMYLSLAAYDRIPSGLTEDDKRALRER